MQTHLLSLGRIALIVLLAMTLSGCDAIGTIFEAGIWVGVIMVIVVLGLVGFIASKLRRH